MGDLYTRPSGIPGPQVSSQELSARSLHNTSIRDLKTRFPAISGPPGKTSIRDLLTETLYEIIHQPLYQRSL